MRRTLILFGPMGAPVARIIRAIPHYSLISRTSMMAKYRFLYLATGID
jgi:hypothetical protein